MSALGRPTVSYGTTMANPPRRTAPFGAHIAADPHLDGSPARCAPATSERTTTTTTLDCDDDLKGETCVH